MRVRRDDADLSLHTAEFRADRRRRPVGDLLTPIPGLLRELAASTEVGAVEGEDRHVHQR